MLAMTYRYVFLLVETASQILESRRSRTVGVLKASKISGAWRRGPRGPTQ